MRQWIGWRWLRRPRPDEVDINMIEALVYIYNGRLDDARLVLNYLHDRDPNDYYVHVAEIIFWQMQDDVEQATHWYEKASLSAREVPQRLRLLSRMGEFYLKEQNYNKALQMYKEALHFNKEKPELWHSISVIYWQLDDFDEAGRANKQALRYGNLPAAERMAEALKQKQGTSGLLSRFRRG